MQTFLGSRVYCALGVQKYKVAKKKKRIINVISQKSLLISLFLEIIQGRLGPTASQTNSQSGNIVKVVHKL